MMEILHIATGDPDRPMVSNYSILFAVIIYSLLSLYIRITDWKRSKKME